MRLDARTGDNNWLIWHCELMKVLEPIVYVDDHENVYGEWDWDYYITGNIVEHKAKKIYIDSRIRTVFINPIDDSARDEISYRLPRGSEWQQDAQKTVTQNV